MFFLFSSRRRHTRCSLVTGVQTCALPICGAASKIIDKLQEKRWVSRVTSEEDNRVRFLSLTPAGKQVLPELTTIANENDEHFFGVLAADEQTALHSVLSKLAEIGIASCRERVCQYV